MGSYNISFFLLGPFQQCVCKMHLAVGSFPLVYASLDGQMDRLTHAVLLFAAADCMAFTWSSSVCHCCHSLCVAGDLGRIDCDSALGCLLCLSYMYSPVFCAVFSFTVGAESGLLCY